MFDGVYQSVIVFYMTYLLFRPATFVTGNGLNINDTKRMGVYIATTSVVVVNIYILFNTYRWDWLMLLIVAISVLLLWFWTGVYTATTAGFQFYQAAPQVYGQLSFWAVLLLTVIICLLPRFSIKAIQKMYFPRDVDIVREQVRQGKFDYLKELDAPVAPPPPGKLNSSSSSELSKKPSATLHNSHVPDDERPIYPPSMAPTGMTRNPRSHGGSDGTDYSGHTQFGQRLSLEAPPRPSLDRPRPSYERVRNSMDRVRPSFEASNDFTSAALLSRMESSQSATQSRLREGASATWR